MVGMYEVDYLYFVLIVKLAIRLSINVIVRRLKGVFDDRRNDRSRNVEGFIRQIHC